MHSQKSRQKMGTAVKKAWDDGKFASRKNGAKNTEVRKRISEAVTRAWAEGAYQDRINGMLDIKAQANHHFLGGTKQYREIALQHHKETCFVPGCTHSKVKIDIHHVDENRDNFLLTNLVPLCVSHHLWENHYTRKQAPFVSLHKSFSFEASHTLPWHKGKCGPINYNGTPRCHGHSYKLSIWVERRMSLATGIAVDFGDISEIVRRLIIDPFDHQHMNDFLQNPTAEHMVIWFWQLLSFELKGIVRIRLWETDNSYAEVTKDQLLRSYCWIHTVEGWDFVPRSEVDQIGDARWRKRILFSAGWKVNQNLWYDPSKTKRGVSFRTAWRRWCALQDIKYS